MPDCHSILRRSLWVAAAISLGLAACTTPIDAPPRSVVFFTNDSVALDGPGRGVVAEVSKDAHAHPRAKVLVKGFAGVAGSPATDLALARRRAQVVTEALVADGVPPGSIMEVARGATRSDPGIESRRVEIELRN